MRRPRPVPVMNQTFLSVMCSTSFVPRPLRDRVQASRAFVLMGSTVQVPWRGSPTGGGWDPGQAPVSSPSPGRGRTQSLLLLSSVCRGSGRQRPCGCRRGRSRCPRSCTARPAAGPRPGGTHGLYASTSLRRSPSWARRSGRSPFTAPRSLRSSLPRRPSSPGGSGCSPGELF